jgi:hypothetical protein
VPVYARVRQLVVAAVHVRQIGQQLIQLAQRAGVQGGVHPLGELLGRQPSLGVVLLQQARDPVPVLVRGPHAGGV